MTDAKSTSSEGSAAGSFSPRPLNAAMAEEVERLLSGRTRDIRLSGDLRRRYEERSWRQTAKVMRSWMTWVAFVDVLTLALNAILLPHDVALSMVAPACLLPPAAIFTALIWRKPRPAWLQRASLLGGMGLILLSVALVGVFAGGEFYERHLTIMLFVATSAITIFSVPLAWTIAIACYALCLYFVFQWYNPLAEAGSVVAGTLFFSCGIIATVVARRTMNILAQKTFLLDCRDQRRVAELADANARLERLARTDPLTGIANRRWMMETLERLWRGGGQTGVAAMLMCDIDHFKALNDKLGHGEGDRCLVKVAGIIQSCVRADRDLVSRHGGEEFLIVLPDVEEEEAMAIARRIRESVEAAALPNPGSGVGPSVTLSVGVALKSALDADISLANLQHEADMALYRAKEGGRNQVCVFRRSQQAAPSEQIAARR
ncbi:GGDEF domain-containing protein [Rhizobium lentis]|uniref:diguanylate cyclase n=1 Tax=Rhizobium lentis TaxID=1138194 RepID=A0A9Q3MAA1_9HYPH|nr:GGDEF domain-containing protein [Rhizobium lentis]MBX5010528.1 diguanylate cyclase [Rhizobium lentis]MBX5025588.1 diguanylate cyclase [Rhizobium lentis]MBX5068652.1 diguanylate cyclase [Rhizobium lentis]MBX5076851.1 diguanylate cyclase [Rhizobium lentis]QSW96076.1 diguanylate cyclase [Rhizobium lentis]